MKRSKKSNSKISTLFSIDFHNRIYGLDILRAIAISFVVFGHGSTILPSDSFLNKIAKFIFFDGVGIFFVLSGYLIGGILLKNITANSIDLKALLKFWKRRWFRTIPTYFLVLTILIILALCGQVYALPSHVWRFYLFIQNLNFQHPNFFNEAWSLSVEEWFYLTVPILLFMLIKVFKVNAKTSFIYSAVSIIILITIFRYYRFSHFPDKSIYGWDNYFRKEVSTRFDSIMYGMIGAFSGLYLKNAFFKYRWACFFTGISLLLCDKCFFLYNANAYQSAYTYVFTFSVVSLGTLLLIPLLSTIEKGHGSLFKIVTYTSIISYSMYLINYSLVLNFLIPIFSKPVKLLLAPSIASYVISLLFFIITGALSLLLYKFFEKPATDLRDNHHATAK